MPAGLNAGSAWIKVAPDMRGFASGTEAGAKKYGATAGSRFTDGFKRALKVGAVVGGALAVAGAGKFLKESIREASDLGESINAVEVTFGKAAGGILKLGKSAATSVGLSKSQFNGLAVQFSAFATTIAGKGGNVTGAMKDLTTRGADFASVMNLDVNEAMGLFQSGLAGETEPLRKFGIDLSAAKVESYAYANGIAKAGEKLTEGQKVQARYASLMEQTAKTQGDFKNTSDSLANSQRILGARWDNIQAKVGGLLIPTLEDLSGWFLDKGLPMLQRFGGFIQDKVIPPVKAVARFLWDNKEAVAAFIGVLAGFVILNSITKAVMAFNLALRLNPIGLVVTALAALAFGLVYAYKKSETFRKIVDKTWAVVRAAVTVAWERFIRPALKAFWSFLNGDLIPVIKFLWAKVVRPIFNLIGKAIRAWWNYYVQPVFKAFKFYLEKILFPVIRFLWEKVVRPVFNLIGKAIKVWWAGARLVFAALKLYFTRVLFPVIRFLYEKVVRPIFKSIGDTITKNWNRVVKPIFEKLKSGFRDGR